MAGDWLKIRVALPDCPQVISIAARTGKEPEAVVGHLIRAWAWAQEFSTDGVVRFVSGSDLDKKGNLPGLADAMLAVKWLEIVPDVGLRIPEWDEHNSHGAKQRAQEAKSKRKRRQVNVRTMSGSDPDTIRTREEKRREESTPSLRSGGRVRARPSQKGPSTPQAALLEHWASEWERTRSSRWASKKQDYILAAQVLNLDGASLEEAKRRCTALLEQGNDAWLAQNASIELLLKRWNQISVQVIPLPPEISDVRRKQAALDSFFDRRREGGIPVDSGGPPALAGNGAHRRALGE